MRPPSFQRGFRVVLLFMVGIRLCSALLSNGRYLKGWRYSWRGVAPRNTATFDLHVARGDANSNGNYDAPGNLYETKMKDLLDASTLSLAPMMEYTDRHFRHLVRLVCSRTLLYTEMVGAPAVYHEQLESKARYRHDNPQADEATVLANYDIKYLQRYLCQGRVAPLEGPSVLQLGGSDPQIMYDTAKTVTELADRGVCDYTAINLNCGCPSPRVAGKGCFGAALMDEPKLVAQLTKELHNGCNGRLPITVKCRIGTDTDRAFTKKGYEEIDEEEEYRRLCNFVETVASNGVVKCFDVHARIAVLKKSFSPADNRKVPPLKYHLVQRLVKDYPELNFVLNGGIETIAQSIELMEGAPGLRGVMIGRAWAADPWRFAMADRLLYNSYEPSQAKHRLQVLTDFGKHADAEEEVCGPAKIRRFIVRAISPLFAGEPRAKQYRVALDQIAAMTKKLAADGKGKSSSEPISELILNVAMEHLSEETLLRSPQESYERFLWQQQKHQAGGTTMVLKGAGMSLSASVVSDWQARRKLEEAERGAVGDDDDVTSEESCETMQEKLIS